MSRFIFSEKKKKKKKKKKTKMLSAAVIIDALKVMTAQGLDCMRVVKIDKSGFFDKYISKTISYDLHGLIKYALKYLCK